MFLPELENLCDLVSLDWVSYPEDSQKPFHIKKMHSENEAILSYFIEHFDIFEMWRLSRKRRTRPLVKQRMAAIYSNATSPSYASDILNNVGFLP